MRYFILIFLLIFTGCGVSSYNVKNVSVGSIKEDNIDLIIKDYLSNNYLLKKEKELIIQSFYNKEISKISLFPSFDASFSSSKSKNLTTGITQPTSNTLSINGSVELDIWGSIKDNISSKELLNDIAYENYKALVLDNVYDIINTYNSIVYINQKLSILNKQLEIQKQRLDILNNRYKLGKIDLTDINLALINIDSLNININANKNQKISYLFQLRTYTGKDYIINSKKFYNSKNKDLITKLINRPDLKASMLAIEVQGFEVEKAIKAKYPFLTLSTTLSSNDEKLSFDNWLASLVGNIVFPIINYDKNELLKLIEESKLSAAKYDFAYLMLKTKNDILLIDNQLLLEKDKINYLTNQFENYIKDKKILNLKANYSEVDVLDFNSKEITILNTKSSILDAEYNKTNYINNKAYLSNSLIHFN